jgi:uncharacterized protein YqgC (DUF456 family)
MGWDILWLALAALAILVGLAGIVVPLLPGTALVFAGLWLIAWRDGFLHVGAGTLSILAVLAVLAWVVDQVATLLGVRRVNASPLAMGGALLGGLLGMLGGLPGILLGPVVGAMLGEWLVVRDHAQTARVGMAAGSSFIVAVALKLGLAFAMLGVFALRWWIG